MAATQEVPPGYDQEVEPKPKSKSAKRNERKKEKRQQVFFNLVSFCQFLIKAPFLIFLSNVECVNDFSI